MSRQQRPKTTAMARYRLGTMQLRQNRYAEAADNFRQALAENPTMAIAWHNLANACQQMRQYDHALVCYRRALQHCPGDPCSLNNLGVLLREIGRLDESMQILEQLTTLHPNDGDGHWNRALSLLTAGDYAQGWQEYEWRFMRTRPVQIADPGTPRWQGEALEDKTILLCCEQAYGDSIQFIRFAATLADWGSRVIVQCPDSSLAGLLSGAPGVSQTIAGNEPVPDHDCWSPLLSVPRHLHTRQDSIPACPYLFAEAVTDRIVAEHGKPKVGLIWSGRSTDPHRACPAELLAPLARFSEQVSFFSLQLNSPGQDLSQLQSLPGIIDLASYLTDFKATAQIMQQLDLIITIDSAPAHLSGALGRETWLLLYHAPDWRWGLERTDSDWYQSIRIFRQPEAGAWQAVIEQVVAALEQRLNTTDNSIPVAKTSDLLTLGDHFREQEQWSTAHHLYNLASKHSPDNYQAQLCTGGTLLFLNKPDAAADWFRLAISLQPEKADAHINLGLALLCSGLHAECWHEFDWRCHGITQQLPPIPLLPAIEPDNRLDGFTILIHAEQGYGDLIQFARYLPHLKETGAKLIITVPCAMVRLIQTITGADQIIPHGDLLPDADFQLPLLSLPDRLSALIQGIPWTGPYLTPAPELKTSWHERFKDDNNLGVGLIWRGNDLAKSGYRRALTTNLLAPLAHIDYVTLYNLQLDATQEELDQLPGIIDLMPQVTDFADTAAIMANLDLVISIDTSTAHLAGALGLRCWVPLLFAPDWRWYPLREQGSRWYPTITTFRQPIPGKWEPVANQITAALKGEALLHQGHQLGRTGRRKEAIEIFRAAAELPGRNGPALLNQGIYLRADGKTDQAKEALQQAAVVDPDYPEAWQNLGLVHQDLGELPEAYTCIRKALVLRPDYATARWNLGLLQLLLGEYREGFRNFEARFTKIGAVARLHTDIPVWDGSPLSGKTLLVHAEQGYGDTIQFVRYTPLLIKAGAQVVLEVQDAGLLELCRTVHGSVQVLVRGDALPAVDLQTPLLSLPCLLDSTLETIPRKIPYLTADKEKTRQLQSRLPDDGRYRIGICWKGRPTPDPKRSIPFKELQPLFDLPDIVWISLQMEPDKSASLPDGMIDLTAEINDFSDTAALMSCLDMVISIDSAVAHLAGALGLPGIVLLLFSPDWRWGLDQSHTPWYPGLRLVRQTILSDWAPAVVAAANILRSERSVIHAN